MDRALDKASSKVEKAVDRLGHAMGTESWGLKVLQRDPQGGLPTLERGLDGVNRTERKTRYDVNGKKYSQETREFEGSSNVTTYVGKSEWDKGGKLLFESREFSDYDNGAQTGGDAWQKDLKDGKTVKEVKRRWTVDSKVWKDYYVQTMSYYPSGEMKVRTTEDKDGNATARETWGSRKADGGRDKSTQTWNGEAKRWDRAEKAVP